LHYLGTVNFNNIQQAQLPKDGYECHNYYTLYSSTLNINV